MALSVNPSTYVITIPKADLTLIQSVPTEIRELNLNSFRLNLKDWEDDVEGIIQLKTHTHNTEVSLGGLTYARVIEILAPYTITFEDGAYAVNLVGANSNVGDRVNVNQVSVRSANSAGLISSPDIEYASFNGGVTYDSVAGAPGTVYPTGTPRQPSGDIDDMLLIADVRGFTTLYPNSDITFGTGHDIDDFLIKGQSHVYTDVTLETGAAVTNTRFIDCIITGVLDGNNEITNCVVGNLIYFNGHIHNSGLQGTIELAGGQSAVITDCKTVDPLNPPTIDMGGSGQNLAMPNYSGLLTIENLTGANFAGIGLDAGTIVLDSTSVTGGTIQVAGVGSLIDENGLDILSGVWNGGVVIINDLVNRSTISEATQLGEAVYVDTASGNSGTGFPIGSKRYPVDNLTDAVAIAGVQGVDRIRFLSDYTFPDGTDVRDFHLEGSGFLETTFTFVTTALGCIVLDCQFENATLTGSFTGVQSMTDCRINDLGSIGLAPSSQEVLVDRCFVDGNVTLPSNYSGKVTVRDSYSNVVGAATPVFDLGNCTSNVQIRNYTGGVKFANVTQGNVMSIDLMSGQVKLDPSTVTSATIVVRGSGKVIDADTSEYIYSGTWNGGVTILSEANTPAQTAKQVWDEDLSDHIETGTTGKALALTEYEGSVVIDTVNGISGTTFPLGTHAYPVDNLADAITIATTYSLENFHIHGSLEITSGTDLAGYTFKADRSVGNTLTITSMTNSGVTYFEDLTISGALSGATRFTTCVLGALTGYDGGAKDCLITGDIDITGAGANYFTNCDTYITDSSAYKKLTFTDKLLNIIRCRGNWELAGKTGTSTTAVDLVAGTVLIDVDCVAGEIFMDGIVKTIDNSSVGCTVTTTNAVDGELIAEAVWNELLTPYETVETAGKMVKQIKTISNGLPGLILS